MQLNQTLFNHNWDFKSKINIVSTYDYGNLVVIKSVSNVIEVYDKVNLTLSIL